MSVEQRSIGKLCVNQKAYSIPGFSQFLITTEEIAP